VRSAPLQDLFDDKIMAENDKDAKVTISLFLYWRGSERARIKSIKRGHKKRVSRAQELNIYLAVPPPPLPRDAIGKAATIFYVQGQYL
jgi:hypothetical protein